MFKPHACRRKNTLRIITWPILDVIFISMSFYTAYLIRFKGIIEARAFMPYLRLWPYISLSHLIIFYIFRLYESPLRLSRKKALINALSACTVSILASISIVYMMRHFWRFIPSSVFIFAWGFNIILAGGWRLFVRYEA